MDQPASATEPGIAERDEADLDTRRVRSFVGLVLGRLGPRAHGAVAGVFLALLVGEHTRSLFWITFALTAHRIVTWIAYPIAGRFSDGADTRLGRRVPFMVTGLLGAAVCIALYTSTGTYWSLVLLLVAARLFFVAYRVPSYAVTPETFGGSRWLRAVVALTLGGIVVGLSIRLTVIATWDQNDPSTWGPAYYLAAVYVAFAAVAILALVREAPSARRHARTREHEGLRATARSALSAPNAKVLLTGLLLAVAAGGAFERVYPIYARDMLGAGGDSLAAASIASTVLTILTFPIAWWLAPRISRKQVPVWAGITFAGAAVAHLWVTELWQSVVILVVGGMFFTATAISLLPLYLRIIPRRGGLAQRIGVAFAPILIAGMAASYVSAIAYDLLLRDYRVIWAITAAFALAGGVVMLFLRIPDRAKFADVGQMWRVLQRILWGRRKERPLFRGDLEVVDTDGTFLLETVQDALDPYAEERSST